MYQVKCDGQLLYDPRVDDLQLFNPVVTLEVNKTGGFDFTLYPSHPLYNQINRLKSSIEVYQDNFLLFRGRVLNDEHDFYNAKNIVCEGDLAFFNDSIIRPYNYNGTVIGFLQHIIDHHNAQVSVDKQFALGEVTVSDPNDYITRSSINADKSWNVINDKLIDLIGGYIMVRRENATNYIDYLEDSTYRSLQKIELGENLLDLSKNIKGENIITALIPYGAKLKDGEGNETDQRLTIEEVNSGKDYVYNQEAVSLYDWVFDTVIYEDVTVANNLLTKANAELASRINMDISIEVSAIDLSMTDTDIDQFRIFEYVEIDSPSHLLEDFMLTSKLVIHLDAPQNNKLTLGVNYSNFLEQQIKTEKTVRDTELSLKEATDKINAKADNGYVTEVVTTMDSNIDQTAEAIRTEVGENYTATSAFETYQQSVSTQFEQTKNSFNFTFEELTQEISTLDGETRAQFEEIVKYIRFVNGNIVLGEVGNEITLRIENDRISFLQSGSEVAYFSNNKLFITDAEVLNSLKLGAFAFKPRANGSLDFK